MINSKHYLTKKIFKLKEFKKGNFNDTEKYRFSKKVTICEKTFFQVFLLEIDSRWDILDRELIFQKFDVKISVFRKKVLNWRKG